MLTHVVQVNQHVTVLIDHLILTLQVHHVNSQCLMHDPPGTDALIMAPTTIKSSLQTTLRLFMLVKFELLNMGNYLVKLPTLLRRDIPSG